MNPNLTTTHYLNDSDPEVRNELLKRVMERLRERARRVKRGLTEPLLQTDGLVNEALQKILFRGEHHQWRSSDEFFRYAVHAMKQVVIDYHRKQTTRGRQEPLGAGGKEKAAAREPGPEEMAVRNDLESFIRTKLQEFAEQDREAARVLELNLFGGEGGLSMAEVADRLGLKVPGAYRARARAQDHLRTILGHLDPCD
jgi:RNA polymerase sigma factor (sigma-70 family)